MNHDRYISPLSTRYAGKEMQYLFSEDMKFTTFHKLWIALAKAEKAMGVAISEEQIAEMEAHLQDIDYEKAAEYEKALRHDVMAQIHAWGDVCPKARPIIHLGATSCYVGDNTDMIIMREALRLVRGKLLTVLQNLSEFALRWKDEPALAYTHLQPAQLTTVGKRATLWMYDLTLDLADLDYVSSSLCLLGSKGTTGTQASFAELFDNDREKVKKAEEMIAKEMGFEKVVPVSGQTYTRKFDDRVLSVLSGIAQSAYKFSNDLRILQSFKELEEPFETNQVGSSAMPYKRNPMRCERICSLSRYLMADAANAPMTASVQWLERTLDDSANRRIALPEGFLCADAVLRLCQNVTNGLHVNKKIVDRTIREYLPFLATENIMMEAVKRGGDRQELHERIRQHSMAATARMKEGERCDLLDRLAADPAFGMTRAELDAVMAPALYTGRCAQQVERFLSECAPLLADAQSADGAISL